MKQLKQSEQVPTNTDNTCESSAAAARADSTGAAREDSAMAPQSGEQAEEVTAGADSSDGVGTAAGADDYHPKEQTNEIETGAKQSEQVPMNTDNTRESSTAAAGADSSDGAGAGATREFTAMIPSPVEQAEEVMAGADSSDGVGTAAGVDDDHPKQQTNKIETGGEDAVGVASADYTTDSVAVSREDSAMANKPEVQSKEVSRGTDFSEVTGPIAEANDAILLFQINLLGEPLKQMSQLQPQMILLAVKQEEV